MKSDRDYKLNRTGALRDVDVAAKMLDGVQQFSPTPSLDQTEIFRMRSTFVKSGALIGSPPPSTNLRHAIILDKMGARLAFEREGTRLYQALMQKHAAIGSEFPEYSDIERIGNQEWDHLNMLQDAILELGGDPTMITPSADVQSLACSGIHKVIQDPRTSLGQCFEVMLNAELIDHAGWEMLIALVREQHYENFVQRFEAAMRQEAEHLSTIRTWVLLDLRNTLAA